MTATPADIARFTTDGVLLTQSDPAIRDENPDAQQDTRELEMFFDNAADAEIVLAERFALLSVVSAVHEGIEISDNIGFGTDIPITPSVPCFRLIDESREIDVVARTRAYVYEAAGDRYSVEVVE